MKKNRVSSVIRITITLTAFTMIFVLLAGCAVMGPIETLIWNTITEKDTIPEYETFLNTYPNGKYATQAKNRVAELELETVALKWEEAKKKHTISSYEDFLTAYPSGPFSLEAQTELESCAAIKSSYEIDITGVTVTFKETRGIAAEIETLRLVLHIMSNSLISKTGNVLRSPLHLPANGDIEKLIAINTNMLQVGSKGWVCIQYTGVDENGHPFATKCLYDPKKK